MIESTVHEDLYRPKGGLSKGQCSWIGIQMHWHPHWQSQVDGLVADIFVQSKIGESIESVETTQIYLDATLAMMEQALAKATPPTGRPTRYKPTDKLLDFLNGL